MWVMAKLSSIKPRLGGLGTRLQGIPKQVREQVRNEKRAVEKDWRAWYGIPRWQSLRMDVFARDRFICQRTGVLLTGKHPAPNSPVAHHRKRHEGDPVLFWDINNIETVSKAWHDSVAQAIERSGQIAAIHPKWLKPSIVPLTIVCGAPASGKSTYVKDHAGPKDLVIDLDSIASEISGEPQHGWDRDKWLHPALFRRNDMLGDLSRPGAAKAAWFIVSEPKAKHRAWWHATLKPQQMIVIETPEVECIRRAGLDQDRDQKRTADAIVRWWFDYERRHSETVVGFAPNE